MISLMLLAAHMAGDFLFQTNWMASNKLSAVEARFWHCVVYTLCFYPVLWYKQVDTIYSDLFCVLIFVTHFIADSRRWASAEHWEHKPFFVDQTIHVITLAVLGAIFF